MAADLLILSESEAKLHLLLSLSTLQLTGKVERGLRNGKEKERKKGPKSLCHVCIMYVCMYVPTSIYY